MVVSISSARGKESVLCIGLTVQVVSNRLVSSSRGERVVVSISSARGKERVFCIWLAVQVVSSRLDSSSRGERGGCLWAGVFSAGTSGFFG